MNNEHVAQLIADAIDVIETKGWCQDASINKQEEVCTLGALDVAKRMGMIQRPDVDWGNAIEGAYKLTSEELRKHFGMDNVGFFDWPSSIPAMNDSPRTTKEDILLGLKHALHRARGE